MNELDRGRLAADVLNNPVYVEAYEAIEKGLIAAWRDATEPSEREHLHRMLRTLDKVQRTMVGVMNSGKIEQKNLQDEAKRQNRLLGIVSRR